MEELKKNLISSFDNIQIDVDDDRMFIGINKNGIVSILSYLKNLGYEHLALISCVDFIEENEFELVYIISSYLEDDSKYTDKAKRSIIIKTRISRPKPQFMTVIDIFENAEPYERELHELFGIDFKGHPRLTSLFLEIDYDIPPFRKDFDTRKFTEDFFEDIPEIGEH